MGPPHWGYLFSQFWSNLTLLIRAPLYEFQIKLLSCRRACMSPSLILEPFFFIFTCVCISPCLLIPLKRVLGREKGIFSSAAFFWRFYRFVFRGLRLSGANSFEWECVVVMGVAGMWISLFLFSDSARGFGWWSSTLFLKSLDELRQVSRQKVFSPTK